MKILVVSGFLGAGKTTFINHLSTMTDREYVILENEFAEISVDRDLIEDKSNIWEMTEGCICCSMKADFANSVLSISNSVNPDYLIIEPTGVGMLSNIIRNLKKVEYDRIKILTPITIVDAKGFDYYLKEYKDHYIDQIANAGLVVLSKTSTMSEDEISSVCSRIREINSDCEIQGEDYFKLDKDWWMSLFENLYSGEVRFGNIDGTIDLDTISYEGIEFEVIDQFFGYVNVLLRGAMGEIVRAKGFFKINGQWTKLDITDSRYNIETIEPKSLSKIILIGKNLNRNALDTYFGELK